MQQSCTECNKAFACSAILQPGQCVHGKLENQYQSKSIYTQKTDSWRLRIYFYQRFMPDIGKRMCAAKMKRNHVFLSHSLLLNRAQLQWPALIEEVKTFKVCFIQDRNLYILGLYPCCSSHLFTVWSAEDSNRNSSITHLWAFTKHQLNAVKVRTNSHEAQGDFFTGWSLLFFLLQCEPESI